MSRRFKPFLTQSALLGSCQFKGFDWLRHSIPSPKNADRLAFLFELGIHIEYHQSRPDNNISSAFPPFSRKFSPALYTGGANRLPSLIFSAHSSYPTFTSPHRTFRHRGRSSLCSPGIHPRVNKNAVFGQIMKKIITILTEMSISDNLSTGGRLPCCRTDPS